MKTNLKSTSIFLFTVSSMFTVNTAFSQTEQDTVKTGKANDRMVVQPPKANDPMVVHPGKANDSMAVKPAHPNDGMSVMTDTGFIADNIADNMMEIQLSKAGVDKGTSPLVKKVAAQMITDHTAILDELKQLAAKRRITDGALKGMHEVPLMNVPKGSDFNATWASAMLTMHEAKIAELEKYMTVTQDALLKAAIGRALPKIRAHRDLLLKIPGAQAADTKTKVI